MSGVQKWLSKSFLPTSGTEISKLCAAARDGNQAKVKRLVERHGVSVDDRCNTGMTPLHFACDNGQLEVAKYLVETGATVDARDNDGWTPLHFACLQGQLGVVRYLVEPREAAVDAQVVGGYTPLHFACDNGQLDVVKYLVEQRGAAVDATDEDGWTPLHVACHEGQMKVVAYLVEQRPAVVDAKDNNGRTPLDDARTSRRQAVVDFLENWQKENKSTACQSDRDTIRAVMRNNSNPAALSKGYIEYLYEEKEMIGKGAYGVVYKVKDKSLGVYFALKQIVWALPDPETRAFTEKSFKTEIAALSRSRHPNIIRLFGFIIDPAYGKHSLLFECAENGSLATYLDSDVNRATLTSTRRLHILLEVSRAVHYLHSGAGMKDSKPFYHRDLKSANICLTQLFTAKLIDCGLGKLVDDNNKSADSFINSSGSKVFGTDGYICPWYATTGNPFEAACDVYSLGIVMMEMITGVLQKGQSSRNGTDFGDFRTRYLEDEDQDDIEDGDKELVNDSDPVAGWEDDGTLESLAKLAVQCCNKKKKKRPKTEQIIDELSRLIHCDELGNEKGNSLKSSIGHQKAALCMICRRTAHVIVCEKGHCLCGQCIDTHVERNLHIPRICCPANGCFSCPYQEDALLQAVSEDIYKARQRQLQHNDDNIMRIGLANLTACTIARCPRLICVKDGSKSQTLKEWVRSIGRKRVHVFLICEHSHTTLKKPIVLTVTRDWVMQIAPALRLSVWMLSAAAATVGIPLYSLLSDFGATDWLGDETAAFFDELERKSQNKCILDAWNDNSQAIEEITGGAYRLLEEKLNKDKNSWWKDKLKPVLDKSGRLIYVKSKYLSQYK